MPENDNNSTSGEAITQTLSAVTAVAVQAVSKSAEMRETGTSLARSAKLVATTIETTLLPLAAVNYVMGKAKVYFQDRFGPKLNELASSIPADDVREPKASVAGPALQGLAFSHEEPSLESMYLNLLTTAMDGRTSPDSAHPAFVEVIKQLSAYEATLLKEIFLIQKSKPVAAMRLELAPGPDGRTRGIQGLLRHVVDIRDTATGELLEIADLSSMIDNWQRLGLIHVDFNRQLAHQRAYEWINSHPTIARLREQHHRNGNVTSLQTGIIERTDFGHNFAKAVGITK